MVKHLLMMILCLSIFPFDSHSGEVDISDGKTLWIQTFQNGEDVGGWKSKSELKVENDTLVFTPYGKNTTFHKNFKWNVQYPYLQIDYEKVVPFKKGYRGMAIIASPGKGKTIFGLGGAWRTGLLTINLLDHFPHLKDSPKQKWFTLVMYFYGGVSTIKSFKMVSALPKDALMIIPGGEKGTLKSLDKVKFKLILSKPAQDVTVAVNKSQCLFPVKVNDQGYIQLSSEDEGTTWTGEWIIPKNADTKPVKPGNWIFTARILGGKIKTVFTNNPWSVDLKTDKKSTK